MPEAIFIPNFIGRLVRTFSAPAEIEAKEVLEDDNLIRINRAIGKVSVIYEKLRNAVDYNDEHLLRKNAIFRLIKRLVVIEKREEKLGLFLIQELIRIKYLPNNSIPESRAQEVEAVLQKYLAIENLARQHYSARATGKLVNWYLQIAACELEDILFDFRQRQALVNAMVRVLKRDVELPENIKPETQNLLFNLTVLRGLLKSDEVVLDYYLLSELTPNFFTARPASETIKQMVFD